MGDPKVICILSRGCKTYSKNMHFAICIFQNLLWGENMHFSQVKCIFFAYSLYILHISQQFTMTIPSICIFEALEICKKYAFCQPFPSICIFEALGICKKYTFYLGKMHIFSIFPRHQKCIFPQKCLISTIFINMHF